MSRVTIEDKIEDGPWYVMKWKGMTQLHTEEDAVGATKANKDMTAVMVLLVTAVGEVSS